MSNVVEDKQTEGWARPLLAKKFHYFKPSGISLCGKWLLFPKEFDDSDPTVKTKDSCEACYRRMVLEMVSK
jgi:hypothetical protein